MQGTYYICYTVLLFCMYHTLYNNLTMLPCKHLFKLFVIIRN